MGLWTSKVLETCHPHVLHRPPITNCLLRYPLLSFHPFLLRGFGWCPYYAARRLIHAASVVVLNYQLPGLKRTCTLLLMLLTFPANLTHGYNGCSICFTCRFCASLTHCHPRSSLPFFSQRCEVCPRLPLLTSQYSRRCFVSLLPTPARYVLDPKVSLASSLGGAPSLPGARRQGSHESHKGIQGYPNVSKGIQGYPRVSKGIKGSKISVRNLPSPVVVPTNSDEMPRHANTIP